MRSSQGSIDPSTNRTASRFRLEERDSDDIVGIRERRRQTARVAIEPGPVAIENHPKRITIAGRSLPPVHLVVTHSRSYYKVSAERPMVPSLLRQSLSGAPHPC